jgi:hypothetical protein
VSLKSEVGKTGRGLCEPVSYDPLPARRREKALRSDDSETYREEARLHNQIFVSFWMRENYLIGANSCPIFSAQLQAADF